MMTHLVFVLSLVANTGPAQQDLPVVTLADAIASTQASNLTWKSLAEAIAQARAGRGIGVGLLLPKLRLEGTWLHMGERHVPDFSGFSTMGEMLGDLMAAVMEEHPEQASRFLPYLAASEGDGDSLSSFVPPKDTLSATFSVVVPVLNPVGIAAARGSFRRYDAAVQRVGHGREQLLYAVANAYYGLVALQEVLSATEQSLASAKGHLRTTEVRARLQAATQLELKRAELEVTRVESQRAELAASLEKAKAGFRYLTGLSGPFRVVEPSLALEAETTSAAPAALSLALDQRRDLHAARIEVRVAEHEVGQVGARYLPSLNVIGQGTADNRKEQRFDDDPYAWNVVATLALDVFDGGIREGELSLARSRLRQARLVAEDAEKKIESEVESAVQGLSDALAAHALAERQLAVARATQRLAEASEVAGAATSLEVIDANVLVFQAAAQAHGARLGVAQAQLALLAACGAPFPVQ